MTVEQTAFPVHREKPIKDPDYVKIREVTGIQDAHRIREAIRACCHDNGTYEIEDVISMLTSQEQQRHLVAAEKATSTPKVAAAASPSRSPAPHTTLRSCSTETEAVPFGPRPQPDGGNSKPGVIDLTKDTGPADGDEIQRAIEESLKDIAAQGILGGQVSREEQEISRLLEQSLEESKAGTKRKRGGDLWFVDPLNPHERKRADGWPVGLKNVGNTCWFSAVIQSLFHLPIFRRLVLRYIPSEKSGESSTGKRNLRFMHELRHIFALMVGSKRKYIDPSKAVDILKEAFSGSASSDSQQDVSEFQHKLLEWLEDAFRQNPTPPNEAKGQAGSSNPMVQLFYGQFRTEGVHEGKSFSNEETFGQFPLQVEGVGDIHASLDAATARGEIENLNSDITMKSGQEQWFTRLPPVLTFELSRFQFNQALGRPEKIHNKLEFSELIFMDRYLEKNKNITRQKREEVKRLREELQDYHRKLDKFVHYGSGPKRFPLQDVLHYALDFAESKSTKQHQKPASPFAASHAYTDVEMESPKSSSSMALDSPAVSPLKDEVKPLPDVTVTTTGDGPPSSPQQPSPRDISPEELSVLQDCLTRWRTEVQHDVSELQERISQREKAVNDMYSEGGLNNHPYRLHAVLVHEGQAASGHYWAYVYCMQHRKWLKFNDIQVTEASWEELQRESVGGYHNASAYCLMYVDATRTDVLTGDDLDGEKGVSGVNTLPMELPEFVKEDNARFVKEMQEWDDRKASVGTETDPHMTRSTDPASLCEQHAKLTLSDTLKIVASARDSKEEAKTALQTAVDKELSRLISLAKGLQSSLPARDPRLSDVLVFMLASDAAHETTIKRALLEKLAYLRGLDNEPRSAKMREICLTELKQMSSNWAEVEKTAYQRLHEDYKQYRKCVFTFCLALEAFHLEKYSEALPYFACVCDMNSALMAASPNGTASKRCLNPEMLRYLRRQCLLHVNENVVRDFESTDEVLEDALTLMQQQLLPCCMALLAEQPSCPEDQSTVEDIRDKWCHFLSLELPSTKIEKLQDFLSGLFDPPSDLKPLSCPDVISFKDCAGLEERYVKAMKQDSVLELLAQVDL
ncbi:hypothetical protein CAPTEDRAFT_220394 [Capitella teleta]|uniref:ubiquitinyl hydrolase 1 n=1 Tax=Capitella teleta TaxID=283909 RepID=R7UTL8_CAPTE|nr:hypothetical protein CAPTEDRAFT_220394 [Capitella teleta]|eukprot:ELU07267.1 hypothetical protein CAPTEDRAFT_220394 [Capitella teleta]